jgi:hypothetical protein
MNREEQSHHAQKTLSDLRDQHGTSRAIRRATTLQPFNWTHPAPPERMAMDAEEMELAPLNRLTNTGGIMHGGAVHYAAGVT